MPQIDPKQLAEEELPVLVRNLSALMQYAADHPELRLPATRDELVRVSGIGRSTIYRLLPKNPTDEAPPSPLLGQIAALAAAYNLLSWELLWPNLDPAAPPAEVIRAMERLVRARNAGRDPGGETSGDGGPTGHR